MDGIKIPSGNGFLNGRLTKYTTNLIIPFYDKKSIKK